VRNDIEGSWAPTSWGKSLVDCGEALAGGCAGEGGIVEEKRTRVAFGAGDGSATGDSATKEGWGAMAGDGKALGNGATNEG